MIHNSTVDLLLAHSSVRALLDQPVSPEITETILKCAQRAPTSSYLQAYTVIQVTDFEKRQALMDYSGGQEWVVKAPLVLLFCADLHRTDVLLHPADSHVLHNAELFTVAVSDAALVAQRAFIAAQACGLGGVIVGGVRNETAKMAALFALPELVFPMYLLCLGYPESIPEQRPRLDTRFIFDTDAYPALPTAAELQEYDTDVSQYFFRTTNGRSDRGWVARTQHAIEVKPRYSVGKFLEQSGFLTQTAPAEC
ncbi:MAG: nitroreductase family protein [Oscillospiraceae bacterium]|nr:nitroreductase family protein [Oscillospiraceae bacterium]